MPICPQNGIGLNTGVFTWQVVVRFWADMSSDGPRKCNLVGICRFLVRFGPAAAGTCSRTGLIHKNRGKNPGYSRYKCLYFHIRLKNTGKNNGYSLYFSRDFLTTHRHLTQQPKHTVKHGALPCVPPSVRPKTVPTYGKTCGTAVRSAVRSVQNSPNIR